jgi:hypothetical protein
MTEKKLNFLEDLVSEGNNQKTTDSITKRYAKTSAENEIALDGSFSYTKERLGLKKAKELLSEDIKELTDRNIKELEQKYNNPYSIYDTKKSSLDSMSKDSARYTMIGMHNFNVPESILSYLKSSEQLAIYQGIGVMKRYGKIKFNNGKEYSKTEINNMPLTKAISKLCSYSWEKDPKFYNKIHKKDENISLKDRIKKMNIKQQGFLINEIRSKYISSYESGNPNGWHDPDSLDSCGGSKKSYLIEIKNKLYKK